MSLYDSLLEKMDGHAYSGYFMSVCPFHDDHSPSLLVWDGGYKCKACGARGSLQKLERKVQFGFRPRNNAVSILPRWKKWEQEYGDLEGIAEYAHDNLLRNKKYRRYYEERQCEKFVEAGRLGFIGGWAVIPVFGRDGRIVDMVVRQTSGKGDTRYVVAPAHDSGGSIIRPLYVPNWKRVIASDLVYVVYGIFDAISLELCGLPVVTGITGKSLCPDQLIEMRKKFVIVPDHNEEGDAHKLANSIGWRGRVKELQFPDGAKDPDDIRRKLGNDALREMLAC